jgi:hypothetical protein
MPDDDDIIAAHEAEFAADRAGRRPSNRGFWLVTVSILLACVVMVVAIFWNRDIKDTIAHAQSSLRTSAAAAERLAERGSYADATAGALAEAEPGLVFVGPATASTGLEVVSVAASPDVWAAAVQVRPEACFYLLIAGGETRYGTGTECTADQALVRSTEPRW